MKRHGHLYGQVWSIDNIRLAHENARRGKRHYREVKMVDAAADNMLGELQRMLRDKTFRNSAYRTFIRKDQGKERLIWRLPYYPDRIVHHALMNVLEPIYEAMFIGDSYACRVGKGIHAGSRRTMQFVRRYGYCLKMDIAKFYPSVDHDILFGLLCRKIKCLDTLWLIRDIIYSFPGGRNVPIGNYTSQWFGNIYLNELDQFLKHEHRAKAYIRYCDDFCLFHDDKAYLKDMAGRIKRFLADRLRLVLSKCDLFPVSRGVEVRGQRDGAGYHLRGP